MQQIPLFKTLRDATTLDAITYFTNIMPVCRDIVTKASSFFKNFNSDYEDFDTFIEDFDDIRKDVENINNMVQNAQELNIDLDTDVVKDVNGFTGRLISERNLRKQRDLFEDSISSCDHDKVKKL